MRERRIADGIPLDAVTLDQLAECAVKLGLDRTTFAS